MESLCLYNLTLLPPSSTVGAVLGQFLGKRSQEIVIATGSTLEIYKPNTNTGKLIKIASQTIFGIIRKIEPFKIPGSDKDYLAVTSDSGNFVVLEFNNEDHFFQKVFNEPFAKSGIRRLSPGEYISIDAKGRAAMLTAIEKNKLVYIMNKDPDNNLTINSPLEANRSKIITFNNCGLDVGYDNPMFASIEMTYNDGINNSNDHKFLTFYELDLGLNHVLKKSSEVINKTANFLLSIPGGLNGPSGVLVGYKNFLEYKNQYFLDKSFIVPIPYNNSKNDVYIICGTVHVMKDSFFILVQSSTGDIFKIDIKVDDDLMVESMQIKYFDSLPICNDLLILKSGFLFANCQSTNKTFYQIIKLDDDNKEKIFRSEDYFNTTEQVENLDFEKHEDLKNLQEFDEIETLSPIIDSKLTQTNNNNKIVTLSGIKDTGSLKFLQYGLNIEEVITTELKDVGTGVFTTKLTINDEYDKYLIISFSDSTMVLSIGEEIEEVEDSKLVLDTPTIGIQQMGTNSLMQIYPNGINHLMINNDDNTTTKIRAWLPPAGIKILKYSATNSQLVIGLSNREMIYFEFINDNELVQIGQTIEMPGQILSLSIGDIPEGEIRSEYLAISCNNSTIRIMNLSPEKLFEIVTIQELSVNASAVELQLMSDSGVMKLFMHLGLENGIYVKTLIQESGKVSDRIVQYLGPNAIKLKKIILMNNEEAGILICCENITTHVGFNSINGFKSLPLSYDSILNLGVTFQSEEYPNGLIGINKSELFILSIDDDLDKQFKIQSLPLSTSPKRLIEFNNHYYIIGNDPAVLKVINGQNAEIIQTKEFDKNERILNINKIFFKSKNSFYIIISSALNSKYYLKCYKINSDQTLEFFHETLVDKPVAVIEKFLGKLIIGMGNILKLYDIGQKQLLRKAELELNNLDNILQIKSQGLRLYVGDIRESITFVTYKPESNLFIIFADDIVSRHVTSMIPLDYDTVIGGDKFGNLWVIRCDELISKTIDEQTANVFLETHENYLQGAPDKLNLICHYFINDIPMSLIKKTDASGLNDSIIYVGLQGTLGILLPLLTTSEIKFFKDLERNLSQVSELMLVGRDHLLFRSYYAPTKGMIDGDLIEKYFSLKESEKSRIAIKMNRTSKEIEKKIVDIRMKISI